MGLRAFIFLVVAFLKLQGSLGNWESNEKNLKWIFDVKNEVTTQNQTFKQNAESGAFRYHYDVSALNTYKYEVQSSDSVTMGCYGWKDAAERWHSTNYVADSHGWRTIRDISQPVDVYPVYEEHITQTFLDNVPQCLSFTADSAPRPSVFTNHPPTPPPAPIKHTLDDHVPHGSEHIHRVEKVGVPALTTARPDSFRGTPPVDRPAVGHEGSLIGLTATSGEIPNTQTFVDLTDRPGSTHNQNVIGKDGPGPLGPLPGGSGSGDELTNRVDLTKPGLDITGGIPTHEQPTRTSGRPNVGTPTGFPSIPGSRPSKSGEVPNTHTSVDFFERPGRPSGSNLIHNVIEKDGPGLLGPLPGGIGSGDFAERPGRPSGSTHNQNAIGKDGPGPLGPLPGGIDSGDELTNRVDLPKPGLGITGGIPTHEQPTRTSSRPNVETPTGFPSIPGSRPSKSGEVPNTQTSVDFFERPGRPSGSNFIHNVIEKDGPGLLGPLPGGIGSGDFAERPGRPSGSTHNQNVIGKDGPGSLGPLPGGIDTGDELTNETPYLPNVSRVSEVDLTKPSLGFTGGIPTHEQPTRTSGRPNVGTLTGFPSTPGSHPSKSGGVPSTQTSVDFTGGTRRPSGSTPDQNEIGKENPAPLSPTSNIIISGDQPPRTHSLVSVTSGLPTSQPGPDNILTGQPPVTDTFGETLPHGPVEEFSYEVTPAPSGPDATHDGGLSFKIPEQNYQVSKTPPGRQDKPYVSTGTPVGKQKPYTSVPSGPQSGDTIFKKGPTGPISAEPSNRPVSGNARGDRTWKGPPTAQPSQTHREPITVPSSKDSSHPGLTTFGVVSSGRPYDEPSSGIPTPQSPYDLGTTPETPSRSTLLIDLPPKGSIEGNTPALLRPYDSTGTGSSHDSRIDRGRTPAYLPPPTTPLTHLTAESPIYLQTPDGPAPYCMCACPRT